MDVESSQGDELNLMYAIEQYVNGNKVGGTMLDALETNPTMNEVRTVINGNLNWSFTGKINYLKIEQSGEHLFRVALNTSDADVVINKAHFIFKK